LAQAIGEKLIHHLSMPYTLAGQFHRNACSIGATVFGLEPLAPAELLKQSDIAMYQVKARQGNSLCFFDPKMQSEITQRAQLEIDLRVALEGNQFELYYQPQVALGGRVVGAEVLLRWRHPVRGMVSPLEFISVAEERELIIPIGHWVLKTACDRLAAWRANPALRDLQLSVNVSPRQFRQADFAQCMADVIVASGVPPALIKLELTESLVLDSIDDCAEKMETLKALGVQFSLDDFGTGHSSLAYLTRLPLDQLKIDQSFVRNLGVRHNDGVIVQTIIGMARNLDLEVIAEGVETEGQRDLLDAHGCNLYQGYLFGRPTPVAEFEAMAQLNFKGELDDR
jgi:EAL domain-containing protein (putative c-di-GMP-specific phosphodiesterase class I)